VTQTNKEVTFGNRSVLISEQNADRFQEELDQVLVLMGLSEMPVVTDGKWSIQAQGEKKGWGIDFYHKDNKLIMGVVMKLPIVEVYEIKNDLKEKYPNSILNKLGGFNVFDSEEAMIELLQKIKYKI
jgi:hypothetical protein